MSETFPRDLAPEDFGAAERIDWDLVLTFATPVLWLGALALIARMIAREMPPKPAPIPRAAFLNLLAQVFGGGCFALLLALLPRALLAPGFGRTLMLAAIMTMAAVWNGDCFYRLAAPKLSDDEKLRKRMSVNFGIFSTPAWAYLIMFTVTWLAGAGPGITRAEFEFFSLELVIAPAAVLLLCPQDKRGVLLDGVATLRLLLLAAVAPLAAIEGHILAHFLDLPMGSPLFAAVWGLSAGVIMEECFRGLYAHFLHDDRRAQAKTALLFGVLANPIWPIFFFGMQGMQF